MSNSLIDLAHAIRPELETILGDRDAAQTLDRQLAALLDAPNPDLAELRQLLNANEKTKTWVKDAIANGLRGTLGFQPLPGSPQNPDFSRYICPEPDCNYTWTRRNRAQTIPHCPTHPQQTLIPQANKQPNDCQSS